MCLFFFIVSCFVVFFFFGGGGGRGGGGEGGLESRTAVGLFLFKNMFSFRSFWMIFQRTEYEEAFLEGLS